MPECPYLRWIVEEGSILVRVTETIRLCSLKHTAHIHFVLSFLQPDVGASQMIIDGKIKLKSDSPLLAFTETGLKFEDGSELPADVVLFATGFAASVLPYSC